MAELAQQAVSGWDSFYVIIGSSGAALIGLQFVVITLIADATRTRRSIDSINAFGTPTVVHFGGALLVAAIMSAPWPSLLAIAIALAVCGIAGIGYEVNVIYRARRQTVYKPVREDWFWYVILPCCAYAALALGAAFLHANPRIALFVIAGAALGLLFIAIHNSWDTVIYIAVGDAQADQTNGE